MEGILHIYHPARHLLLFEHVSRPSSASTPPTPPNVLLFVGGMYDNFLSPLYTTDLLSLLAASPWSVMHVQLSSAGRCFGISSLDRDIEEIGLAVDYIRSTLRPSGCVVLLGHSTGCQDILHYLSAPNNPTKPSQAARPAVEGAILQAPVSDRDQVVHATQQDPKLKASFDEAVRLARSAEFPSKYVLPMDLTTPIFGPVPLTASRFLSLASPDSPGHPGVDDLFSHDLPDSRLQETFGAVSSSGLLKSKLLVLMGQEDEFVPAHVDKGALLDRWRRAIIHGSGKENEMYETSTVIPGAYHGLFPRAPGMSSPSSSSSTIEQQDKAAMIARKVTFPALLLKYLDDVVAGSVSKTSWGVWEDRKKEFAGDQEDQGVESVLKGLKL